MEIKENGFIFSDDRNLVEVKAVHHYLSTQSYWAKNIPFDTVKKAVEMQADIVIIGTQRRDDPVLRSVASGPISMRL